MIKVHTIEGFSNSVTELADKNGIDIIDAILTYCHENEIELEVVPRLLSMHLRRRLEQEARGFNLLKNDTI